MSEAEYTKPWASGLGFYAWSGVAAYLIAIQAAGVSCWLRNLTAGVFARSYRIDTSSSRDQYVASRRWGFRCVLGMMSFSGSLACSHSCYMRSSPSQLPLRSRVIARPLCRSAPATVAAAEASEKRQATKASEFQGMGAEKIDEEVQKSKRALFDLRIAQRTKQVGIYRPLTCFLHFRGLAEVQ